MKTSTFRAILTASWLLIVVSVALDLASEPTLPLVLREYLALEAEADVAPTDVALLAAGCALLAAVIVSYVGLYFWKRWARTLFVVTTACAYFLTLLDPSPVVLTPIGYWLGCLAELVGGALLASLFWVEPISGRFGSRTRTRTADAAMIPQEP